MREIVDFCCCELIASFVVDEESDVEVVVCNVVVAVVVNVASVSMEDVFDVAFEDIFGRFRNWGMSKRKMKR